MPAKILKEDGGYLLKEDGGALLLEFREILDASAGLIVLTIEKRVSSAGFIKLEKRFRDVSAGVIELGKEGENCSSGIIELEAETRRTLAGLADLEKPILASIFTSAGFVLLEKVEHGSSASQVQLEKFNFTTSAGLIHLRKIGRPILITPINEAVEESPVTFVWEIPSDSDNEPIISHIQVDKSSDAFEDLEIYLISASGSGFEYWNGVNWAAYPPMGVPSAYYGNQARIQLTLTLGTKYWRVRGSVR